MKKSLTAILSAVLCLSASSNVFAAGTQINDSTADPKTANTTVNYTVAEVYTVVIPESITLGEEITIKCTTANTAPGKAVKVAISGLDSDKVLLSRKNDANYKIKAEVIQNNNAVSNNDVVASFQDVTAGTGKSADPITFENLKSPDANPIKAGSYSGTVTFTVSYQNA